MNPNSSEESIESNSARKRRLAQEFNASRTAQTTSQSLTRTEREELNALSKEVFGTSSRWRKLVGSGYSSPVLKDETEMVPADKEGDSPIERTVQVQVKQGNAAVSEIKRHTVETVREYMLERKEQIAKIRAEMKRQQDEARENREKEALAKKVHEELAGSAI